MISASLKPLGTPAQSLRPRSRLLLPGLVLLFSIPAFAVDEFPYDLRLLQELEQIDMMNFAGRQLQIMQGKYPEQKERLQFEQAKFLYRSGKITEADAAVAQIPASSPFAGRSRALMAEAAVRRNDAAAAKRAFSDYFTMQPVPAAGAADDAVAEYKRAVEQYAAILAASGSVKEGTVILDKLVKLGGDERDVKFKKAQLLLNAADQLAAQGKPLDAKQIDEAKALLDQVRWKVDSLGALAVVESAHANYLQKKYDAAIKDIKAGMDLLQAVNRALKEEGMQDYSPVPGAWLYYARSQMKLAQAAKAKDPDGAAKMVEESTQMFKLIRERYPRSPYAVEATKDLSAAGVAVAGSTAGSLDESAMDAKFQEADLLVRSGKLADAMPLYLSILQGASRPSAAFTRAGTAFVDSAAGAGQPLQALAAASMLADFAPQGDEDTAAILRLLGVKLYKAAEKLTADAKDNQIDWAMTAWQACADFAPQSPTAATVAFAVADNDYGRAVEAARAAAAKDLPDGPAKEAFKARSRALFESAEPKFRRLTEMYPATERAARSWYKLGGIYYSLNKPLDAANAYLTYVTMATEPGDAKAADEKLDAKFRVGEQFMAADKPEQALQQFREFLSWLEPEESAKVLGSVFNPNSEKAKTLKEAAVAYIGWCLDLQGELIRKDVAKTDGAAAKSKEAMDQIAQKVAQTAEARKKLEAEREKARREYDDLERLVLSDLGAGERAKMVEKDTKGLSGGELEQATRIANDKVRAMVADTLKRERSRLPVEKSEMQNLRETELSRKTTLAERARQLQDKLKAAQADAARLTRDIQDKKELLAAAGKRDQDSVAALETAKAEVTRQEQALEAAKKEQTAARASGDKAALAAASNKRGDAAVALKKAEDRVKELAKAQETRKSANVAAGVDPAEVQKAEAELATLQAGLGKLQDEAARATLEQGAADALLQATAKSIVRNELAQKLLAAGSLDAYLADAGCKKAVQDEMAAWKGYLGKVDELVRVKQAALDRDAAAAEKARAGLTAEIAASQAEREPLLRKVEAAKREAEKQFRAYLAAYPQGKQVPDIMSRLGTILSEFKQFDEAAKMLEELASKYPGSKAGRAAFFNTGRAQYEIGRVDQAASAFERALKQAKDLSLANLVYITDSMLAANRPALARAAAAEVIARSQDKGSPDNATALRLWDVMTLDTAKALLADTAMPNRQKLALDALGALFKEKPNTFYFFEAKFLMAQAKREMAPPDLAGAIADYGEILRDGADDAVLSTRALNELGDTLVVQAAGDKAKLKAAGTPYLQVVMFTDSAKAELRPFIEHSLVEGARVFAQTGDANNLAKMLKQCGELFPDSKALAEIRKLAASVPAPAPAADDGKQ